jgi:hypothetical protein
MKLNKKVGLIVIIVVIVAALASLFTIYFRQAGERGELNERLSRAEVLLPNLVKQKEGLEDQLAQAQSSLDSSQAKFPQSVESIEYGEYIFEIADRCDLTLASLNFPKPTNKKIGSVTYSVVSLSLPVRGALADIFDFIDVLRTDKRFASTEVKSVNLNVEGGSAAISVDIYGYKR